MIAGSPEALETAAWDLRRAGTDLAEAAESVSTHAREATADWAGDASEAALAAMTDLSGAVGVGADVCAEAWHVLLDHAAELRAAQEQYAAGAATAGLGTAMLTTLQDVVGPPSSNGTEAAEAARDQVSAGQAQMTAAVGRAERANADAAVAVLGLTDRLRAMPAAGEGSISPLGQVIGDFAGGAWGAVTDSALLAGGLAGLHGDFGDNWAAFGEGVEHGLENPVELGKAVIGWEDLVAGEYAHWAGSLAPAAVATVLTLGGGAALRGAKATENLVDGAPVTSPGRGGGARTAEAPDVPGDAVIDSSTPLVPGGRSLDDWDAIFARVKDPTSLRTVLLRGQYAEEFYASARLTVASDINAVSRSSGYTEQQIAQIHRHVFTEDHRFDDGGVHRFDTDEDTADAWRRLRDGDPHPADLELLAHELVESERMSTDPGLTDEGAHYPLEETGPWWTKPSWYELRRGDGTGDRRGSACRDAKDRPGRVGRHLPVRSARSVRRRDHARSPELGVHRGPAIQRPLARAGSRQCEEEACTTARRRRGLPRGDLLRSLTSIGHVVSPREDLGGADFGHRDACDGIIHSSKTDERGVVEKPSSGTWSTDDSRNAERTLLRLVIAGEGFPDDVRCLASW